MTRYFFFDLDGTLSDTHGLARATWLEVLRPYDIDVDIACYRESIHGHDREAVLKSFVADLSEEEQAQVARAEREKYRRRMRATTPLPGLASFLERATDAGFGLALVTNAPRGDALMSLEPLGFTHTFQESVFADDDDVAAEKPDPSPYRAALQRLDLSPDEVVAFEDSETGVASASAAGIRVVGLATTQRPADLRKAGASSIIGDYADSMLDDELDPPARTAG